jgi:hypothetical protein
MPVADALEVRDPRHRRTDSLAVDNAGARVQFGEGLHNKREAVCQFVAGAAVQLDPLLGFAGDNSETVVLDFVQPLLAGPRLRG